MSEIQFDEPTLRSLWIALSLMALLALGWLLMASHDAAVRRHRRSQPAGATGGPPWRHTLAEAARRISWLWSRDLPLPWSGRRAPRPASSSAGRQGRGAVRRGGPATRSPRASSLPATSAFPQSAPLSVDEVRAQETRSRVQQEFEQMRQAQRAQFDKARQARAAAMALPVAPAAVASAFADTAPMPERAPAVAHRSPSGFVRLDLDDAHAQTLVHAFAPTAPMEEGGARRPTPDARPDAVAMARAGFQPLS